MTAPEHVLKTIAELEDLRDNAQDLITNLREIYRLPSGREVLPSRPQTVTPSLKPPKPFSRPPKNPKTVSDVIRQVIMEAEKQSEKKTAIQITDRVMQIRPDANRDSVSTTICQMVKAGELRKTPELHVIPNGFADGAAS